MNGVAFILNLPWTIIGIAVAVISLPKSVRIHRTPLSLVVDVRSFWWQTWLAQYKGVRATTIGQVILLGRTLPNDLEHELIHVEQYRRAPFIHPFLYVYESLTHGYRQNKYEVEAYQKAQNVYLEK